MSQSDEYGYDDYDDYGQDDYDNYDNMEEEKMMGGEIPLSKQVLFLLPILLSTHNLEIHRFCYSQRH